MFSKIAVLSLFAASVSSVSGKGLRNVVADYFGDGRVLQVGVYCPYTCLTGCVEVECTSWGCMNQGVFNGVCDEGSSLLDKECTDDFDTKCTQSVCCSTPEESEEGPTGCDQEYEGETFACRQSCGGNPCQNANSVLGNAGGEVVNGYCSSQYSDAQKTPVCCAGTGCSFEKYSEGNYA